MTLNQLNRDDLEALAGLLRRLLSADFSSSFTVALREGASYAITLKGIGGAADVEILFSRNQLEALKEAGCLILTPTESGYVGTVSNRAVEEYNSIDFTPGVFGLVPSREPIRRIDDELLQRIAKRSQQLLLDVRKNFELYRRQASLSFVWTLIMSSVGMMLIVAGIVLSFIGHAGTLNLASISGILTEFLAAIFLKQAAAARSAQDRCQEALLERQRILELVELTQLISDDAIRDEVTQDLMRKFVLGANVSSK